MTINYLDPDIDLSFREERKPVAQHKLNEGANVFAIMPPFGTNHQRRLFAEWTIHWGFTDSRGNTRPIVCTYKYEGYCPICEASRELYNRKTALVKAYMDEEKKVAWDRVPDDIKAQHAVINEQWNKIRSQNQYVYNAADVSGAIKLLRLSKTAHEALTQKLQEARDKYNINPASLNAGCYFVITRTKTGPKPINVKYDVDFFRSQEKDANGEVIERIKKSTMPEGVINNFEKLAIDIHALYPIRSSKDVQSILLGDGSKFDQKPVAKEPSLNNKPTVAAGVIDMPPKVTTNPIMTDVKTVITPNVTETVFDTKPQPSATANGFIPGTKVEAAAPAPQEPKPGTTDDAKLKLLENYKKILGL